MRRPATRGNRRKFLDPIIPGCQLCAFEVHARMGREMCHPPTFSALRLPPQQCLAWPFGGQTINQILINQYQNQNMFVSVVVSEPVYPIACLQPAVVVVVGRSTSTAIDGVVIGYAKVETSSKGRSLFDLWPSSLSPSPSPRSSHQSTLSNPNSHRHLLPIDLVIIGHSTLVVCLSMTPSRDML